MMLKNYWYIIALGVLCCIISVSLQHRYIMFIFYGWVLLLWLYKRISIYVFFASLFVTVFFIAYLPTLSSSNTTENTIEQDETVIQGQIVGPITETEKKIGFLFESIDQEKLEVVYFKNEDQTVPLPLVQSMFPYGSHCKLYGEISYPPRATNPHQFDFQTYLWKQGISSQFLLHDMEKANCTEGSSMNLLYIFRSKLLQFTDDTLHKDTTKWLHALVFGDDHLLEEEIVDVFQRWGLSHILAISGLHIGIVVALLYVLLTRLPFITKEKAYMITCLFLPLYAIIAGGEPSVWRASLMVVFVIIFRFFKWKMGYLDLLSLVFILLILLDKYIIYHVGFQLSFLVTFGIILSRKWLEDSASSIETILKISFVSQMMILPLQLHYFSIFEPLSIIVNIIVVPYFSIIVIPLMFGLLLISFLPKILLSKVEVLFQFIHEYVIQFIFWIDTYLHFPLIIGKLSFYFIIVYYVIFVLLMTYVEQKERRKAFQFGVLLSLYISFLAIRPYLSPYGTVTMLDIGQGDAYVIELPYRKGVYFVDAGAIATFPDFDDNDQVYRQIIKPYLYGQGIQKVDAIFISHEDMDHDGSIRYMLEDITVDKIIISNYYQVSEEKRKTWEEHNVNVLRVSFQDKFIQHRYGFSFLSPAQPYQSANDNSLVFYTEIGGLSWLFTGDISKSIERKILEDFPNLTFDILKVAHHGSNTSTDPSFAKKTNQVALVSVGSHNTYGHPTKEVIDTLHEESLTIYRTDIHGAVQYRFKGEKGVFVPFLEK